MGVPGVLDGGVRDLDAEDVEEIGEVVAVLVLLALGQHDEAPPPATYSSIASISSAVKTGLPESTVRSQRSPEGCAITKASAPARTAGVTAPSVCAVTTCPRRRSSSAARA
nr:hypothetical protein GCM10020093_110520 [Planobispora longispora]